MSVTGIILAAVIVGGTGLFIGVFLGVAGKKFAVEVDERCCQWYWYICRIPDRDRDHGRYS